MKSPAKLRRPIRAAGPSRAGRSGDALRPPRRAYRFGLFALALVWLPSGAPRSAEGTPPPAETAHLETIFDGFYQVGLDLDHPLQVENLVVKKDVLELTLKHGTLYLTRPFEGEITGALFSGEAFMSVSLPNAEPAAFIGLATFTFQSKA